MDICDQQVRESTPYLLGASQLTPSVVLQDVAMTAGVKLAPTFRFYSKGQLAKELKSDQYPELEVSRRYNAAVYRADSVPASSAMHRLVCERIVKAQG